MAKVKHSDATDHLKMDLFAPGMGILHRAGLGGLACTLHAMQRQHEDGYLRADQLPAPLDGSTPPWEITDRSVTLNFGKPENAGEYLRKLFAFAFQVREDGLIFLPGQFRDGLAPSAAILADLQTGILLTFLQHGRVRQMAKEPILVQYDVGESETAGIVVEYKKCSSYKHQSAWENFQKKNGELCRDAIKIDGPISPGTVVRHVAFTSDTAAEDTPDRMLPLYFALIGCMSLPVNRGVAALLVPEVVNLTEYLYDRPAMTPTAANETMIANAADAALQAQIRLRKKRSIQASEIPGCYSMTFMPTVWASQQKSRVATLHVHAVSRSDDKALDRFERALALLPTRIVQRVVKESAGKGKKRVVKERTEAFRASSIVRPLVAENLAMGQPWYKGFQKLMTKLNPATDKPYRDQLPFERKGLHAMISDDKMWDQEGERLVVQAVHEAIRQSLGRIRQDTDGEAAKVLSQATKNRWERFREKLRLDLAGAKSPSQVRFALMDLFSRGGNNSILRTGWEKVLPVIRNDWTLARDLGLLALASYAGKSESEVSLPDLETH